MRHIHLDPVGGIAGDMFVAALLNAFPELASGAIGAAQALAPVHAALVAHRDHILAGSRFDVVELGHSHDHPPARAHSHDQPHDHDHAHTHDRGHMHWSEIRTRIEAVATLTVDVRRHAIAIFTGIAEAEARVHGIEPDRVAFHEVGAADSIADILAAAWLIDALAGPDGAATWSVAPLPLGSGMIDTAHGPLPVPAPATALLLAGFDLTDDGIPGERVTPTGAAILRHLGVAARPAALRMDRTGIGFGTRTLPGRSNCLRALVFTHAAEPVQRDTHHRELLVIEFEVDDQSGEDLATGLDRIRAQPGVHDVLTMPATGKKGRITLHIQVLADPARGEDAVQACFAQTTTIGLRTRKVSARALPRRTAEAVVDGRPVRVKIVERPGGNTGKAELDDLAPGETHASRAHARRRAEAAAT